MLSRSQKIFMWKSIKKFISENNKPYSFEQEQQIKQVLETLPKQQKTFYEQPIIGQIVCYDEAGKAINKGIAVLVSPNIIVTTASNIIDKQLGLLFVHPGFEKTEQYSVSYKGFKFYPINEGQIKGQRGYQIASWRYPTQFIGQSDSNQPQNDFTVMKLINKIHESDKFPKLAAACNVCLSQSSFAQSLRIFGPPYLKMNHLTNDLEEQTLKYGVQGIDNYYINEKSSLISYETLRRDYLNGSPLLSGNSIIGINIQINNNQLINIGKLFSKQTVVTIKEWISDMNGEILLENEERMCYHAQTIKKDRQAYQYFLRGKKFGLAKDCQNAIVNFSRAIEINENYFNAYQYRGDAYIQMESLQQAMRDYDKSSQINPKNPLIYEKKGKLLFLLKDYKNSILHFEKAIQINPTLYQVYYFISLLYKHLEDHQNAMLCYDKIIQINPNQINAYMGKGLAYFNIKDFQNMIRCYDRITQIDPNIAQVYQNIGIAYRNLKDDCNALINYEMAININPNRSNYFYGRGLAYFGLKKYQSAIDDYNRSLQINPHFYQVFSSIGQAYCKLNEYQKAITSYNKSLKINPYYDTAYNGRGIAYVRLNDIENALSSYDKAIQINPSQAIYYSNRGILYSRLGKQELKLDDFTKAIQLQPTKCNYYIQRGRAYYYSLNYDKSLMDLNAAIQLKPNEQNACYYRGLVYLKRREYQLALKDFENAFSSNKDSPQYIRLISICRKQLNYAELKLDNWFSQTIYQIKSLIRRTKDK